MTYKGCSYLSDIETTTSKQQKRHLRIVVSNVNKDMECLVVTLVSKKYEWQDSTCVLNVGDHPFIKHPSVIDYKICQKVNVVKILNGVRKGLFLRMEDVAPDVLKRIQDGVKESEYSPGFCEDFYDFF